MAENRFPAIWLPSKELQDLRSLLRYRHHWVRMRTRIQNALQSIALANGLRRGTARWSHDGQSRIASLPLAPHTAYRRSELQAMYEGFEAEIEKLNQRVEEQACKRPGARLLLTHPGVGPITAMATEVFLGDPARFADSKALASYVGMIPRKYSSGGAILFAMGVQAQTGRAQQTPAAAGQNQVTAIDILLEADATMLQHAAANSERLLEVFPKGFSLDATGRPHFTSIQRFVRTADLEKVYPFTVETGPIGAFTVPHDNPAMDAMMIDYVSTFVPEMADANYNPHGSTGVAPKEYLDQMQAEPFEPFTFSPSGAAVYQLGPFRHRSKKTKEWGLKH